MLGSGGELGRAVVAGGGCWIGFVVLGWLLEGGLAKVGAV